MWYREVNLGQREMGHWGLSPSSSIDLSCFFSTLVGAVSLLPCLSAMLPCLGARWLWTETSTNWFEQSARKAEEAHKSIHLPENRIHVEHCQTNMFLSKTDYNYTLRKSEGDEERAGKWGKKKNQGTSYKETLRKPAGKKFIYWFKTLHHQKRIRKGIYGTEG